MPRRKGSPRRKAPGKPRQNPAAAVLSRRAIALSYYHAQSAQDRPYEHRFGPGVLILSNPDGSITLKHPSKRLWADFVVGDDA